MSPAHVRAQEICPVASFWCNGTASMSSIAPSWCNGSNPFIVAQPPTSLAPPSTDFGAYVSAYKCADAADPFSPCQMIQGFVALEATLLPGNGTIKLIVITSRTSNSPTLNSNSSLSIYNDQFELLDNPISGFAGNLNILEAVPAQVNGGASTFVAYGGESYLDWSVLPPTPCAGDCFELFFLDMRVSSVTGATYTTLGAFFQANAQLKGVHQFSDALDAGALGRLGRSPLMAGGARRGFRELLQQQTNDRDFGAAPPTVGAALGPSSTVYDFAAALVFEPGVGWTINFAMYMPAGNPQYCPTDAACVLAAAQWTIVRNGAAFGADTPLTLRTATAAYNCGVPPPAALEASYDAFYTRANCNGSTVLLFIGTPTSVSVFAFARNAGTLNAPLTVDLATAPNTIVFDADVAAQQAAGSRAIVDFAPFAEVALTRGPNVTNATAGPPDAAQPSSVWLAVATVDAAYNGSSTSGSGSGGRGAVPPTSAITLVRLPQFSDALAGSGGGAFPPVAAPTTLNPAGYDGAAQPCPAMQFWTGAACAPLPYTTPLRNSSQVPTALAVRWRKLPAAMIAMLVEGGCSFDDVTCVQEALAGGGIPGLPIPFAEPPPPPTRFSSDAAHVIDANPALPASSSLPARLARRAQGMPPADRAHLRRIQAALAAAAEAAPAGHGLGAAASAFQTAANIGNRFLLFVALRTPQLLVLDAVPLQCLPGDGVAITSSQQNALTLMGPLKSLYATRNGQYLFGSVDRPQFALAAMERLVQVCNALAGDPSNLFLAPWAGACSSADAARAPRLPAVADFLAVASACLPNSGMWCPSFSDEVLAALPAGTYSSFGFDARTCEPGFLCTQGTRQPCPPGFTCPHAGTQLPQVCAMDAGLAYSCADGGLVAPVLCPNGTLCGIPYLPALPAPPGFAQTEDAASGARSLAACPAGGWCGLGRSLAEAGALDCPPGTYCSAPSVLQPTVCDLDGNCTAQGCPLIPFCPAASEAERLCPAGTFCGNTTSSSSCSAGSFCPAGSPLWSLCPAQRYCPTPAQSIQCPSGFYCPEGSVAPLQCNALSACYCPGGCAAPPSGLVLAATAITVALLIALALLWRFWGRARWQAARERAVSARMATLQRKRGAAALQEQQQHQHQKHLQGLGESSNSGGSSSCLHQGTAAPGIRASVKLARGNSSGSIADSGDEHGVALTVLPPRTRSSLTGTGTTVVTFASGDEAVEGHHTTPSGGTLSAAPGEAAAIGPARSGVPSLIPRARNPFSSMRASLTGGIAPFNSSGRPESALIVRKVFPVHVRFNNLGLALRQGGAKVLQGVSGELRPGRICAVMGPSGAGKTTCLTSLCGKASYGVLSGDITINGAPGLLTDPRYKHLVGFVPQEDIMMRDLTVEENITFSALSRLPATWSMERKVTFADYVIDLLQLGDLRDSLIGDETSRGISGGQRKRVNIGLEIAADPQVLLLDEPTSGLDAAGCTAVCSALRRIADMGVTVALVLHQPRFEIFASFDDLLLLGKGGRTVYYGPVKASTPYLEAAAGLQRPPLVNPADFLLDVVGGDVPADWRAAHPTWTPADLFPMWTRHLQEQGGGGGLTRSASVGPLRTAFGPTPADKGASTPVVVRNPLAALPAGDSVEEGTGLPGAASAAVQTWPPPRQQLQLQAANGAPPAPKPPRHEPLGFGPLVWLFLVRSATQQLRHPFTLGFNNALVAVSALFLAALYFGDPSYTAPQPLEAFVGCPSQVATACQITLAAAGDSVLNRGVMTIISLGLTGVATFLPVFSAERIVYWREASSLPQPLHTVAYFIGKDLAMLPQLLLGPLVFTVAYTALTTPRAGFLEYYCVFLGVYWCASGFGYLVSVLSPPSMSQLLGVVTIFSNAMFAGGQPTLRVMRSKFIPLSLLPYVSFMRYALEALYVMEVRNYEAVVALQGLSLAEMVDNNFGYDLGAFSRDVAVVFAFGLAVRGVALACMLVLHRDKKL